MNSDDLMVFLSVAEAGSVTKAAAQLGYVPSNVSARIHHLETETETTLFYRHSRGMTLTSSGKTLVEYAQRMRRLLHDATVTLQSKDMPRGTLSIGAMETTAAVRLPKMLVSYHRSYAQVEISLVTGPTSELIQQVLQYKIDGAFISGPSELPELSHESVFHEELVLISDLETDMRAIAGSPILVFRTGCSYRFRLEQW
jgi:DNA-binding transcriptional LysR family regulator